MTRFLFVNRFFHPDHSATSQLLADLTFHLADRGFVVEVLTSAQLYDDPSYVLPSEEIVHGVRVHRIWTTRHGRGRLLPRAVDYLTFYLSASVKLASLVDRDTVVVTETDPPLMSIPSALIGRLRRATIVNWTQDLFPEVAQGLSVPGMWVLMPLLRKLRNASLGLAYRNVVLGETMAARLRAERVDPQKIAVIHNWSVTETDEPRLVGDPHPLRSEWGLHGKLVIGYSGNFGRVHDFSTVLDAAARLRNRSDVRFLFIGDGAQRTWIEQRIAALQLSNVVLKPYQPLDRLPLSLSAPDLHLVSLKAELEGLVMPSKLYAVLAAGRGVLFVGDTQGETARVISAAGCGRVFAPGAAADLSTTIKELADDRPKVAEIGARARALWSCRFKRSQALSAWQALLTGLSDA